MLYKDAGVDIDALNAAKHGIGKQVLLTYRKNVKSSFGLFGGIYPLGSDYLVSSIDSVGTKIIVACSIGKHTTVGQDIVNHCVNDILTTGALPIFFMDYIGFSEMPRKTLVDIVTGIARACKKENIVLVGGETAQLSKFYPKGLYDLVGCIVGRVSKKKLINTARIKPGDLILGLRSSGLHTNGYSLARKVLLRKYTFNSYVPKLRCTIAEELMKIHRSYRKHLAPRLRYIKGMAHITGGGFYDNIKRILPQNCAVIITKTSWRPLPVFTLIQTMGQIPDEEMYRVFNMGIGMTVVIDRRHLKHFRKIKPITIGEVVKGDQNVTVT